MNILLTLLFGAIAGWLAGFFVFKEKGGLIWNIIIGLLGGFAGQMGDLFASLVKRHCKLKDYSNLFPGHGGMLDRLDSVLFMAVLMYCYLLFDVHGLAANGLLLMR